MYDLVNVKLQAEIFRYYLHKPIVNVFFILPEEMSLQTLIMLYVHVHAYFYLQHVAIVVSIFLIQIFALD